MRVIDSFSLDFFFSKAIVHCPKGSRYGLNLEKGINSISVENLPAGMYHFSVISPNGERISKTFVKTN
jgi:hypothetical protein